MEIFKMAKCIADIENGVNAIISKKSTLKIE